MSNSVLILMKKRRSIRKYKPESVPKELLLELIEAAIWAPTGSNIQPWYFVIINKDKIREQIKTFSPGLIGNPPNLIIVCTDKKKAFERGGILARDELCVVDASMASQNIMLLATEKGLATCPVKSFNKEAISKILKVPPYISVELIISVGYSEQKNLNSTRRDKEKSLFFNQWGENDGQE